eukprot:5686298-Lingulodinium_polyedra.AAC.1
MIAILRCASELRPTARQEQRELMLALMAVAVRLDWNKKAPEAMAIMRPVFETTMLADLAL